MNTTYSVDDDVGQRIDEFQSALRDNRLEAAEALLRELEETVPDLIASRPVYRMMLSIHRDGTLSALQQLRSLDSPPEELVAFCLRLLGDPMWEGTVRRLAEESPDAGVRAAMRAMLGERQDA